MSRKRSKLSIDRLSRLPDGVICHVLSFLPTQLSVSTCVLAKRWRFLWAHVPIWYFHGDMYSSDVIHRVMLRHKAKTIHTLRITSIEDEINEYKLETWVTTAMERNIRNLRICFGYGSIALLHQALFTCKTMVDMRLDNAEGLPSTGDICLPSLKKLHLSEVEFEDDEALPHLLSGCPLLQELILDYAVREGNILGCINISSLAMKRLEFSFQIHSMYVLKDMNYKILIDAPAVRCLCVGKCYLGCTTIPVDMTSLVEVDIQCYVWGADKNDHSNLVEFANHLRQIRCLKISCHHYLKVIIDRVVGSIVKFNNLTKLELQLVVEWHLLVEFLEVADNLEVLIITISEFSVLNVKFPNLTKLVLEEAHGGFVSVFLENADNLEVLAITLLYQSEVEDLNYWVEPKQVPTCLISHLKYVAMDGFEGVEPELDMTKYLLRNSKVLKDFKIKPRSQQLRLKGKFEELKKVLLERGSDMSRINSR